MTNETVKKHGGRRPGAGRKKGSGRYGEKTSVIRVPYSRVSEIKHMLSQANHGESTLVRKTLVSEVYKPFVAKPTLLKLYSSKIAAGLPSPVEDHCDETMDLNDHLLKNPNSTFFVRVSGDSMIDAGIHPGDLLVVDRGLAPSNGKIVVAVVDGESTVKRMFRENGRLYLMPENPAYPSIEITEETAFMVWGVVTNVIHAV
jgi:DNA polymerase V